MELEGAQRKPTPSRSFGRDARLDESLLEEEEGVGILQRLFGTKKHTPRRTRKLSPPPTKRFSESYNRFAHAVARVKNHGSYQPHLGSIAPHGVFGGRPIIGEKTKVNGGVYLSAVPVEAVVVDDEHGELVQIYRRLLGEIEEQAKFGVSERQILARTVELTLQVLPFDSAKVRRLLERERLGPDHKTSLDLFLIEGAGVARHQVLVAAFLLQRLKERGFLPGFISLDPLSRHPLGDDERLHYVNSAGYLFVFDPVEVAQNAAA